MRDLQRANKRRRAMEDPTFYRRMHQIRRDRAAIDPEYAAHLAELERAAWARKKQRIANDPDYREHLLQRRREYYAAHAAQIQDDRRTRYANLSLEEKAARAAAAREATRNFVARRRTWLTPEQRRAANERFKEYRREWKRKDAERRALAELQRVGAELERRLNK